MSYDVGERFSRRYSLPVNRHSYPSRFSGASAVLHVDRSGAIVEKHFPKIFIHQEDIPLSHRYPKYQPPRTLFDALNRDVNIEASHHGRRASASFSRHLRDLDTSTGPQSNLDDQLRRCTKTDSFQNQRIRSSGTQNSKSEFSVKTDYKPANSYNAIKLETKSPNSEEEVRSLRKRTEKARERLSQQKVMLDRYLPLDSSNTSVQDEVQFRYGQLVEKMPYLEENCRLNNKENKMKVIEPYEPVNMEKILKHRTSNYTVSNNFTPKMSDTRRRARSVLCKVKGDPNYFNYQR